MPSPPRRLLRSLSGSALTRRGLARIAAVASVLAAGVAVAAPPAGRSSTPDLDPDAPKTSASLVTEFDSFVAGRVNYLGVRLEIVDGWHVYWPGQNDTGFPLTAEWTLGAKSSGVEISPRWVWPAPERHVSPGDLLDHVFHDELLVMVPIAVPAEASGELMISARLDWLVCREICLFEGDELSITVPIVAAETKRHATKNAEAFRTARIRHTKIADSSVRVERSGTTLTLTAPAAARLAFYPDAGSVRVSNLLATGIRDRGVLSLDLAEPRGTVSGIVEAWNAGGDTIGVYRIQDPPASDSDRNAAEPADGAAPHGDAMHDQHPGE